MESLGLDKHGQRKEIGHCQKRPTRERDQRGSAGHNYIAETLAKRADSRSPPIDREAESQGHREDTGSATALAGIPTD